MVSKTVAGKVTANDNIGIGKIELYKDGILFGTSATSSYSFDWDTSKDSNGTHTLIAMAYDISNNRSSAVVSVNVQNLVIPPPTIAIQSPNAGATITGSPVTLKAEVTSSTGIAGVQFKLDGVNLGPEITLAPYTLIWNTASVSKGAHALSAVVRDIEGNTNVSAETIVQVNRQAAPVIRPPLFNRRF
jgi:hypothetical protein